MDSTILLTFAVVATITIFFMRKRWQRFASKNNLPIAPNCWPIIGHAHYYWNITNTEEAMVAYEKMSRSFIAPIGRFFLGPFTKWVVVKDPNLIYSLLNHRSATKKDPLFYRGIRSCTGHGIFTREGDEWKVLRKFALPMSQPKNITNFQEVNNSSIDCTLKLMEEEIDQGPFNIAKYTKYASLKFYLEGSQHIDNFDFYPGGIHEMSRIVDECMESLFVSMVSTRQFTNILLFTTEKEQQSAQDLTVKLAKERKKILKQQNIDYMKDEPIAYLDHLMKVAELEGKDEAQASIMFTDVLVGAFDSQATVNMTVLVQLAIHQEYQQKAYEEVLQIFGNSDRPVTEHDTKQMKYIDMCIKEALRTCITPITARCTDADIKIDGYFIPKGTSLVFDWFYASRDPVYWEKPEEFYPDHFIPEVAEKRPRGSLAPFSIGPRACTGQVYSYQAMKTTISSMLRKYHFTTDLKPGDLKYRYMLLRSPSNTMVKITRRKTQHL